VDVTVIFTTFHLETEKTITVTVIDKTLIGYSTTQVVFIDGKLNHLAFVEANMTI
jgi:hypothetical protein